MDIMVVGESSGKGQAVIPPTPYGARLLAHLDFSSMGPDSVRLFGSDFFSREATMEPTMDQVRGDCGLPETGH
jgi:hypothetical protein